MGAAHRQSPGTGDCPEDLQGKGRGTSAGKTGAAKDAQQGRPGRPGQQRGQGGKQGPKGPVGAILCRLLRYMRPHAGILTGVIVAVLATTVVELAPPWIIRWTVDRFIEQGAREQVWRAAGGLLALSLVQGGIDFLRLYLNAYTGQSIVFEIRNDIFQHLSRLSFSFYDQARTGDLMSRVTADVDVLNNFFGRAAVIVLTNLLTLIGILAVLLIWDWRLGLLYVAMLPLIILGLWGYAQRVRPAMGKVRRKLANLTSAIQESLAGILVVKLFGRERFQAEKVGQQSHGYLNANLQTLRITSLWMPYTHVVMGTATALVLWIGGRNVITGAISLGTLIGFMTYIQMLLRPVRQTGMMLSIIMRSLAAAERVFEVLDTQPGVQDAPDASPLPLIEGYVQFTGVSFSYDGGPNDKAALHNVALEARPGEMVALVGPSGAGKTTLVHLLPRFYDAQQGTITLDGHDIRQVTVKSLRESIGIALQTVFLFDASIGENIAYGAQHATRKEIEWAARVVQMHDFIQSLPLGYGTPVGERGVRLSGGQKQRIALARVLLTDPRILILDEPTSSVDADTERRMQQALHEVRAGRTTFVIAHRLWTVQQADQILVLRNGHVVERARGTEKISAHEALLAAGGFYSQLYKLQFKTESLDSEKPASSQPRESAIVPSEREGVR